MCVGFFGRIGRSLSVESVRESGTVSPRSKIPKVLHILEQEKTFCSTRTHSVAREHILQQETIYSSSRMGDSRRHSSYIDSNSSSDTETCTSMVLVWLGTVSHMCMSMSL